MNKQNPPHSDDPRDIEIRRLRDALKEIAELGSYYTRTPRSTCIAREALGCKKMSYKDKDFWKWVGPEL